MKYKLKLIDALVPVLEANRNQPAPPPGTPLHELFRPALQQLARQFAVTSTEQVRVENRSFTNSDGQAVQLRVFSPTTPSAKPLLYWMHGGGTMSGLPEQEDGTLYAMALELNCVITSVNYRLAPEHPYPKPLDDCYEGLVHVVEEARAYGIDANRVAVGGGSAGGLLSTSCAFRARDEGGPRLVHQSLTYPMLDHRDTSDSNQEVTNLSVWDSHMNHYGFACYLRDVPASDYARAVPMLVDNLGDLPDTYIAVGTMDCLRDEAIEYAQKLAACGVQVELHIYPGVTHVFDALVPDSKPSRDLWKTRLAALRRAFGT